MAFVAGNNPHILSHILGVRWPVVNPAFTLFISLSSPSQSALPFWLTSPPSYGTTLWLSAEACRTEPPTLRGGRSELTLG